MLCKAVPSLEVREQQFTDIAISYLDGLYVEILGVLLVDNLAPFSDSDSVWLDFTLDSIRQEAFNKDSSLNMLCHMLLISGKGRIIIVFIHLISSLSMNINLKDTLVDDTIIVQVQPVFRAGSNSNYPF
mgnify:CR=1 FL=1